eukprot:m.296889 g.296889  ORF g.296889 m.296889 type:complete len:69 (+) comp22981_c0_seq3:763-969(+)
MLAIKSKNCAQAYQFFFGSDIAILRVKWTKISRGVFRRISNVHLEDTVIERGSPVQVGVRRARGKCVT